MPVPSVMRRVALATAASRTRPFALKNSIVQTESKPAFSARTAASTWPLMSERVRINPCFIVFPRSFPEMIRAASVRRDQTRMDRFVAGNLSREGPDRERGVGEREIVRVHLLDRY